MCHLDNHMQTASPWRIQGSWDFQGEFSKDPDKDWHKSATSITISLQNTKQSSMLQLKHTNLSIKLGFISRLYIVKSRKAILFNKISPTSPERIQSKIGLYTIDLVLCFNIIILAGTQCNAYCLLITFMLFVKVPSLVNTSTVFNQ